VPWLVQDGLVKLGDRAEITRTFSAEDLDDFARLGGHAPDEERVPGPLIGSMFSCLLGMQLPGSGTNYLKQETRWLACAPIGRPLTASVEITRLRPDKHLVDLVTTCRDETGRLVAEGRALVYVGDVAIAERLKAEKDAVVRQVQSAEALHGID
jgi:acyl dehydratase